MSAARTSSHSPLPIRCVYQTARSSATPLSTVSTVQDSTVSRHDWRYSLVGSHRLCIPRLRLRWRSLTELRIANFFILSFLHEKNPLPRRDSMTSEECPRWTTREWIELCCGLDLSWSREEIIGGRIVCQQHSKEISTAYCFGFPLR